MRLTPLLILLALSPGCSDANSLADPTIANAVDTVTIGALVGTPITTPTDSDFGEITSTTSDARTWQFALKLSF